MLWLTYRQHRMQVLITAALLAAVGILLLAHGWQTAQYLARHAPAGCPGDACTALEGALGQRYQQVYQILGWLPLVPALIGAFWGAPVLAREFERGTHQLAWTQSVSRARWLATKLAGLGGIVALGGLALGIMVIAWLNVFHGTRLDDPFSNAGLFVISGVASGAWWLFAFALGVAAGAVFRRMVPAMAVTLAVTALLLFGLVFAREHYAAPSRIVETAAATDLVPVDAVITRDYWTYADGRKLSSTDLAGACADVPPQRSPFPCLLAEGYSHVIEFHPPSRFWRFQWTETALLLTATLLLTALALHQSTRRRA
jgi:hypothetical protein